MNPFKSLRRLVLRSTALVRAYALDRTAPSLRMDLARLQANRVDCAWLSEYGFVSSLCQAFPAGRIVEIGVAYGYHAEQILDACPMIRYLGIDPFVAGYDATDALATDVQRLFRDTPENSMHRLYQSVTAKLAARFKGRAAVWRMHSQEAADFFPDRGFDLVYVDGDHTLEGVTKDLSAWIPKIKPGGIFCGDDYDWDGVRQAVNKFAAQRGLALAPSPPKKWLIRIPE